MSSTGLHRGVTCATSFFFSSRRRHTRCSRDWSSDVCSSDLSFLRAGATVVTTCVVPPEQDRLAKEAGALSARLSWLRVDVTDEGAVKRFAEGIVARHGRGDVLVNIVGGFAGGEAGWGTDQADWGPSR